MRTAAQDELGQAWEAVADWATYVLMREGLECVALIPLARFARAAEWIVRHEARSDSARRRQLAAMLCGRMSKADPDLLGELFEGEARRVREVPREDEAAARESMIESAGVGACIVDAAALWCRRPALRPAGLGTLRQIVEAALAGEGWTNLERAAMALAKHAARARVEAGADRELLGRLRRVLEASGDVAGARLIAGLLAGDLSAVAEDDAALSYGERAAGEYRVAGESRLTLDRLLEAAEAMER